jgi:hypothetical protein
MDIINTLIIIIIGLIIVNLSSCYNIEGISCNVEELGLGDTRYKNTGNYTGYYMDSDGYYEGIRPNGIKIDSTKTTHQAALDCLHKIGLKDIIDVVEDKNINDRQIKINTKKVGDYKFKDDQGTTYSLNAWNTSYSHDVDYYDDVQYGLIKNISFTPLAPSWL